MLPPNPCCCGDCNLFSDDFGRAELGGDYTSTGLVSISDGSGSVPAGILSLEPAGSPSGRAWASWTGPAPTHFSASADVWIDEANGKQGIAWQVVGAGGTPAGKRYYVEVEASDQDQFVDADHSHCGTLRIYDISSLGTYTLLGREISIPGLTCSTDLTQPAFHRLTFCHDADLKIIVANIKTADQIAGTDTNPVYAHHVTGIDIPAGPITDSEIWLFSRDAAFAFFDNFSVSETKDTHVCPCAPKDLQFSDDFSGRGTYPENITGTSDSTLHWWHPHPNTGTFPNCGWVVLDATSFATIPTYKLYCFLNSGVLGTDYNRITVDTIAETGWPLPLTASIDVLFTKPGHEAQIRLILDDQDICASLLSGPNGLLAIRTTPLSDDRGDVLVSKAVPNVFTATGHDPPYTFNTLSICYDDKYVTAKAVLGDGRTYKVHWEIGHHTGTTGPNSPVKVMAFQLDGDSGPLFFQNFSVSTVQAVTNSDYDYGIGLCDNGCPCCGPKDCQTITLTFPDDDDAGGEGNPTDLDPIDCRIATSGTVVREDDFLKLSASASITWDGSYSGISGDCLIDDSTRIAIRFQSPDYGAAVRLGMKDTAYSAVVTLESALGADDGTLQVGSNTAIPVSGLTINANIDVCFLRIGRGIEATVSSTDDSQDVESELAETDDTPKIVAASGEIDIASLEISHNVLDENCPACESQPSTECDVPCQDPAHFPGHAIFQATPVGGTCDDCAGMFATHFLSDSAGTALNPAGCPGVSCMIQYETDYIRFPNDGCAVFDPADLTANSPEWKFIALLYVDADCNVRMKVTIIQATYPDNDPLVSFVFRSGVLGTFPDALPTCPGLRVTLDYESVDPPDVLDADINCDFRGGSLEVTLR